MVREKREGEREREYSHRHLNLVSGVYVPLCLHLCKREEETE